MNNHNNGKMASSKSSQPKMPSNTRKKSCHSDYANDNKRAQKTNPVYTKR
ncbi:hypothetical protein [Bartonella sp. A05]|nr:hypothetical protein [Bartonella sp. A05]MCZ2203939.1 hypothetical protein [Bartonella sp. A05]